MSVGLRIRVRDTDVEDAGLAALCVCVCVCVCVYVYVCICVCVYVEYKTTVTVNECMKILQFDKINTELFYPKCKENKATTMLVYTTTGEVTMCLLKELCYPKKGTLDYLTSEDGDFSWGNTTDKEHKAYLGKIVTTKSSRSSFCSINAVAAAVLMCPLYTRLRTLSS